MKIVLLGAPGCGKGTQAEKISREYKIPHISTGEIFRDNIQRKTPLGVQIDELIRAGNFCPDELTIEIVKDRLSKPDCQNGYLLDGFPRNLVQAKALKEFEKVDKVINIEIDFSLVETRITGRRTCSKCGKGYHILAIGNQTTCSQCGGLLVVRKDDNVESVKTRLKVYKEQTEPLIVFYKNENLLVSVDGNKEIDEVFSQIRKVLG